MKNAYLIFLFISLITTGKAVCAKGADKLTTLNSHYQIVNISQGAPGSHLFVQENGSFALILSCEDALGNYLTVSFWNNMGSPAIGNWKIDQRFWSEAIWSSDPQTFFWYDKNFVVLSTSGVGGHGGIYLINLMDKKSKLIFQNSKHRDEAIYTLTQYDENTRFLFFEVSDMNGKVTNNKIKLVAEEFFPQKPKK